MSSLLMLGNFLSSVRGHRHYCEDLAEQLEARGTTVVRASNHQGRARKLVDMVHTAWTRRRDYAVAHVDLFSGPAFTWAEVVCFELARLGKPVVLTLHGGNLPEFAERWPRRTRRLLASATAITAPSGYLRERMTPYTSAIRQIPNGIDLSRYVFMPRAPRPRLIWVRAFHQVYNPLMAVDVLAAVARVEPTVTLCMVGPARDTDTLDKVKARARTLGVADKLELAGPVAHDDIPALLARGDVFLNTSNADNAPVSILEAMAAGLCVTTTSVGGIPFLLEHGRNALLVPPGDVAAMTDGVLRLLRDPLLATSLSHAGRALAATHNWDHVAGCWRRLLAEVSDDA